MKNIVQSIAMFAVIFAFGAVANAQINYGAEVDVPFEFSVGEKVYEAGRYTVKINKQLVAGAVLSIQKIGSDEVQSVMMNNNGGERSSDVQLVFGFFEGRRFLTNVTTSISDYSLLRKVGQSGRIAKVRIAATPRSL
ncbi:MAG TPA: hypothetical protein VJ781_08395 [Pyrinomonadaceae bacterium]|nr:hypothetical protein [Pyrinomonadaceae bacterium]